MVDSYQSLLFWRGTSFQVAEGSQLTIDVPLFIPNTVRSSGCPLDVDELSPLLVDWPLTQFVKFIIGV